MKTTKFCVMMLLAVGAAISLSTAAMAQQVSRHAQFSKISASQKTKQRGTTRSVPSKLKVLGPAPDTNQRPQRTEAEKKFAAAAARLRGFKQWKIGVNATGLVYPNSTTGPASRKYNLQGTVINRFLHYEKQGYFGGINLGWTNSASAGTAIDRAQWIFERPGGPSAQLEPLVYGEPLALGWSKGSKPFLKYAKRNVGINLDWSGPKFEWTILGRKPGTNVRRGQDLVILYNLKHKLPMMYMNRTKGAHIGWPDSKKWASSSVISKRYLAELTRAAEVMMGR